MMKTSTTSLLIQGGTVVRADGEKTMDVLVTNGEIRGLGLGLGKTEGMEIIDAKGLLVMPGLIDCHVHFREPGLEHKATMESESAAAYAGGVTTVCEMPNTVPPTVSVNALQDKVRRSQNLRVDMRFFFGATEMHHLEELKQLFTDASLAPLRARCCGLKLYLDHSTGDQKAPKGVIDEAFRVCAELKIPVVCHCEDTEMNAAAQRGLSGRSQDIAIHSEMRPPESEEKSIKEALALAKKYGTHLHVAHLSTKGGVDLIRAAKKSGITVTCEVAPHHLLMTIDDYTKLGPLAKMNPPLRTKEHQDALWAGIADGTIDCVSTDHAPHTLQEKLAAATPASPLAAPSGVPGVETMLSLLMSVASGGWLNPSEIADYGLRKNSKSEIRNPKFAIVDIVRLCFTNPNHIFNVGKRGIVEGAPADLILVDPKKKWVITGKELHSKCGWTPYEGWKALGEVVRVIHS